MTREEVKKALECCSDDSLIGQCMECPLVETERCMQILHKEALEQITKEERKCLTV